MYWVLVYWRWLNDENFERGPEGVLQARAGAHPAVGRTRGAQAHPRATCIGHGIGRHSEAEMTTMAVRGIDALSQILGDNRVLPRVRSPAARMPRSSRSSPAAWRRIFNSPVQRTSSRATANLVAYHDRMMAEFFPDF